MLDNIANDGSVLEVGSGTGEHGIFITQEAPDLEWSFTDYNQDAFESIEAWMAQAGRAGLYGPYKLDAASAHWGEAIEDQSFDAIFSANVVHISPFVATKGIFAGAKRLLKSDGRLVLYGPFSNGGEIAESNASFDADLKRRDPAWGVRDVEHDLTPLARDNGLELILAAGMPANNFTLVFARV